VEVVPVVLCFDEKFGGYATVTIASALANADAHYKIYCLYSGDPAKFPRELFALANRYKCEIIKVDIPDDLFANWGTSQAYSKAVYYRLLIPQVVAEPRAIYMDSDILVTCGLSQLLSHDLGDCWLGGCVDPTSTALKLIELPPGDPYLNSGVLLLDTEALRRHRPLSVIGEIYQQHLERIRWPDQCLINKMAEGRKAILPSRWNVQFHVFEKNNISEELARWNGGGILHFSGPTKPWMEWSPTKISELWALYARIAGIEPDALRIRATEVPQRAWVAARNEAEGDWKAAAEIWKEITYLLIEHVSSTTPQPAPG
jgi:lipopolysaccharide biosynthesis glycosyltransferase